jgi:hypothetical protein
MRPFVLAIATLVVCLGCDPVFWYSRRISLTAGVRPHCLHKAVTQVPILELSEERNAGGLEWIRWRTRNGDAWGITYIEHRGGLDVLHFLGAYALKCERTDQLRQSQIAEALVAQIHASCAPVDVVSDEAHPLCE